MKYFLFFLLAGCTSQEREVEQVCELTCTDCKLVELKCDTTHKKDNKELGNGSL